MLRAVVTGIMLENIQIVLVNTSHPGNIGGVARAMKNMCLENLRLVDPVLYPHAQATARASGADDVLQKVQVFSTLADALKDCSLVLGASARLRRLAWPELDPRQCASESLQRAGAGETVAIVFGRENSGLTNEELELCHYLVHIPSNPEYSSLNLAAAVQVIAYELQMASREPPQVMDNEAAAASSEQMELFYEHLFHVISEIGFLSQDHPRKMMRRLRRLFNRAQLDVVELNIMRGILSTVQKNRKP